MKLANILITDEIDNDCVEMLRCSGLNVTKNTTLSKDELLKEIPKYQGLIVRSATKVTAEVLDAGRQLQLVGRAGTGVDNIDLKAATQHGVIVMNTPGGNTLSAAELTCAMIMTTSRNIVQGSISMKNGKWDRKNLTGQEVNNKVLGIIGLGRIGKEVALRMQAFGMTTIGYDPITPPEVSAQFNTQWTPLEELWPQCDYITVHTPLIPQTHNLINADVLNKCKHGVIIINCARGGIIDEEALVQALNSGQCGAAGLDVFDQEPPTNKALVEHPRVTCTPHLGASTNEAQSRVAVEIAQQIVDYVQGKGLVGAVNAPAVLGARSSEYMLELAKALGQLLTALVDKKLESAHLKLKVPESMLKPVGETLKAAVLTGIFRHCTGNNLNLISAPFYAAKHDLQVSMESLPGIMDTLVIGLTGPGILPLELTGVAHPRAQPYLKAINKWEFADNGPALTGNMILCQQDTAQGILHLLGNVLGSGYGVCSYQMSSTDASKVYTALHLNQTADNLRETIPNCNIVALTF